MNAKMALILLGVGGAGFLAYKYFFNRPALTGDPGQMFAQPNANLMAQPSQSYPYKASTPPRVDNQSEPWYGGSRLFNLAPDMKGLSSLQSLAGDIGAVSDISSSLSSLWSDLDIGSWFDSGGDDFSLEQFAWESEDSDSFDWGGFTESFGGSEFNYSNIA